MPKPMRCIICGCHQDLACEGGCSWVSLDPPLCDACDNPEDLRGRSRPAENLLATPELTKHTLRRYFYAMEIYVSVTGKVKDVWFVELHSYQNEKVERFGQLVKALFLEARQISRVKYQVWPENFIMALEKVRLRETSPRGGECDPEGGAHE